MGKSLSHILCIKFIPIFLLIILQSACKKECKENENNEYIVLQPIQSYSVQTLFDFNHPDFYLLKTNKEINEVFIRKFKFNGSLSFVEGEELIIGLPIFINYGVFEPLNVTFFMDKNDNSIFINIIVKEIVKSKENNPRCISSWFKFAKSQFISNDIKIKLKYELQE